MHNEVTLLWGSLRIFSLQNLYYYYPEEVLLHSANLCSSAWFDWLTILVEGGNVRCCIAEVLTCTHDVSHQGVHLYEEYSITRFTNKFFQKRCTLIVKQSNITPKSI